jgi:hypothetical protein
MRRLCFVYLLAVCLLPAAEGSLPGYLPPETKALIGVRLRSLAASPFFKDAASQAMASRSDWMAVASMIGFDPLKDIDEILIASASDQPNAPALLVVRGRFDVARLSNGAKHYRGVPLIGASTKTAQGVIALVDSSTALAGDAALVHAAIDRRGNPSSVSEELVARAETLRERYDIWGIGTVPKVAAANMAQAPPGLDAIDRFEFGLILSKGLELSAELHARSQKDLEKLAGTIQLFQAMTADRPGQPASGVKFESHMAGETLKLAVFVPEAAMRKAMQSRAAAVRPATVSPVPGPATVSAPVAAKPPVLNGNGDTVIITLPGKH